MTYPDYKKKVREEFDERFGAADNNVPGNMPILKTGILLPEVHRFYEKAFDNLLVEVEGCIAEPVTRSMFMKSITHADVELASIQARAMEIGHEQCRAQTLRNLTRFKGEDTKV